MLDIAERLCVYNNHDDITRIGFSASHARQSLPLIHGEVPFTRTGFEEEFLEYSSYLFSAKEDGVVIYKDETLLIVKYFNSGKGDIIPLGGPYGNREGFDKILFTTLELNDEVVEGQILARHSTISEDGFLTLGCNLKTTYISNPYNYKDALVISESCAKKMSTRIVHEEILDCCDTIPILWYNDAISYPQGTFINKAQKIFIVKQRNPKNAIDLVSEGKEITAKASGKLYYKLIIDEIVKTRDEEDYYNNLYKEEIKKEELIASKIKEIYDTTNLKESLECTANINYYCPQLQKRRSGNGILLKYWIVEEQPIIRGCKITNRHGNKGVVSKILPDNQMPKDKNGEYCDVVVNSMCITSRMNIGQLFELHINRANYLFTTKVVNDNSLDNDTKLEKLYDMISKVQPYYINKIFKETINSYKDEDKTKLLDSIKKYNITQLVVPPFTKFTYEDCLRFCKEYGGMDDSLKEPLEYNGETIEASFGHTYWYRLEHEPNKKYFARSVGLYGRMGQPSKNIGGNKSAHRVGELETWSLLAHQAYENLLEFFVSKSDSISEAARMLKYLHDGMSDKYTPFIQTPGILGIFKIFCNAAGYDMEYIDDNEDGSFINTHIVDSTIPDSINDIDSKEVRNTIDTFDNKIDSIFEIDKELELLKE